MRFRAGVLALHREPAELTAVTHALNATGRHVVLVPTMGALHAGHRALIESARRVPGSVVVVSVFVNPLQFGAGEDLQAYPRELDRDLELLDAAGVELVFAPSAAAMYPHSARTRVHPGPLGDELEGAARPGHFAGMLTVVAKLFTIVGPRTAYFGEKDYQQLTLVRQMVADLNLGVRVAAVPTVREPDGLALSSRNVYLDPAQRRAAVALSAALAAGAHAARGGGEAVLRAARSVLGTQAGVDVDYLELRDPYLGPAPAHGDARLLVAARLGRIRLIDNVGLALDPAADPVPEPGRPEG